MTALEWPFYGANAASYDNIEALFTNSSPYRCKGTLSHAESCA